MKKIFNHIKTYKMFYLGGIILITGITMIVLPVIKGANSILFTLFTSLGSGLISSGLISL